MRMKKLVLLSIGMCAVALQPAANAQSSLYTTYNDFSGASDAGWGGGTPTAVSSFSTDASTVNGLGNSTSPGGAGTSGSLLIAAGVTGWTDVATLPGLNSFAAISAVDPGYANDGVAVAATGNIYLDYSSPNNVGYFQMGVLLGYAGNGYWPPVFSSSTTDLGFTDPNGLEVYRATIPYSIAAGGAGSMGGIGVGIMVNTDRTGANAFYVDNISVSASPVPEPGTMALAAMGGAALLFFRRRSVR